VGFGTGGLLEAVGGGEDMLLYCAGLFAGHHRPAASLERMLAERFGLPVEVLQFQGRWLSRDWRAATAIGSPVRCGFSPGDIPTESDYNPSKIHGSIGEVFCLIWR
jgi:predicted component of type VI protein secretion system